VTKMRRRASPPGSSLIVRQSYREEGRSCPRLRAGVLRVKTKRQLAKGPARVHTTMVGRDMGEENVRGEEGRVGKFWKPGKNEKEEENEDKTGQDGGDGANDKVLVIKRGPKKP